jgi:4-hydroxy-4-methyl-2-oxoglutarate aldolase
VGGIVSDGLCRDAVGIRALGVPTFVRGTVPSAPQKVGPGEIGGEVHCGGVAVRAGDIVVADDDGVVVVPRHLAEHVIQGLRAVEEKERRTLAELDAGADVPSWLGPAAEAAGTELVE